MRLEALGALVSPRTGLPFEIQQGATEANGEIREGYLVDGSGSDRTPIRNFIPRFVRTEAYTASFGLQWNLLRRTQIDRFNGTSVSADRFYSGTGWTPDALSGQRILEVGCGAGRFTQVMVDAGAEVYSMDYSTAVDACWANHGPHPRLTIVQGNLFEMPFKKAHFDKVFCYGVLQHTPDPKRAFMGLTQFVGLGGQIAIDVYAKERWPSRWTSKYLWRPLTKRMSPVSLFRFIEWYVPRWLPIDNTLQRVPGFGKFVAGVVPCWNYTGILPLDRKQIEEWAILDTFDALSPQFDSPQTVSEVRSWFEEAGLSGVEVKYGGNGVIGNGRRP
jgi:SAM-dependent methyltransferase